MNPRYEVLSREMLLEFLRCEPETGRLFWRERSAKWFSTVTPAETNALRWNTRYADIEAFTTIGANGYRYSQILGRKYLAHRIVWQMVNGDEKIHQIDHRNGIKTDNRIDNLRVVSSVANCRNGGIRRTNTSGINGVWWNKQVGKWWSSIGSGATFEYLGSFERIEDAAVARKAAETRLGYSPTHGLPAEERAAKGGLVV